MKIIFILTLAVSFNVLGEIKDVSKIDPLNRFLLKMSDVAEKFSKEADPFINNLIVTHKLLMDQYKTPEEIERERLQTLTLDELHTEFNLDWPTLSLECFSTVAERFGLISTQYILKWLLLNEAASHGEVQSIGQARIKWNELTASFNYNNSREEIDPTCAKGSYAKKLIQEELVRRYKIALKIMLNEKE